MWSPFLEDRSLHLGRGPAFSLSVSTHLFSSQHVKKTYSLSKIAD
jgi:hypothetical protein